MLALYQLTALTTAAVYKEVSDIEEHAFHDTDFGALAARLNPGTPHVTDRLSMHGLNPKMSNIGREKSHKLSG